jgi:hypothetical protein
MRILENNTLVEVDSHEMKNTTEITIEILLVSALNVIVVYLAAFTYHLNWTGILTVMVFASVVTATASQYLLMKWLSRVSASKTTVGDGVAVMLVALFSSLAVLVVLSYRFNLPMALGISLLSGLISSLLRHLLS